MSRDDDVARIAQGLEQAREVLREFTPGKIAHRIKDRGDPVTEADLAVNDVLLARLPRPGEGWLSEETVDDPERLAKRRVWIVDPVDGTREFIDGIPEWCVSIGLAEEGRAVAGGICNPSADFTIIGSVEGGAFVNGGARARVQDRGLDGLDVVASRSEIKRGEWRRFAEAPFDVRGVGSVAYKMALVAAGRAAATWTLKPKNEWDVAAGTALVIAAGGQVLTLQGNTPTFNRRDTKFQGLFAAHGRTLEEVRAYLRESQPGGPG